MQPRSSVQPKSASHKVADGSVGIVVLGRLSNITNLTEDGKVGGAVQATQADNLAGNVLSIIRKVQVGGDEWSAAQVEAPSPVDATNSGAGDWHHTRYAGGGPTLKRERRAGCTAEIKAWDVPSEALS